MTEKKKKPVETVRKPFLTGNPTDENTWKAALGFFGAMILVILMTFLVCNMMNFGNDALRIGANIAVEAVVLLILYNNAIGRGTEAVARGEILYQRQEKGKSFTDGERAVCFHPLKGYLNALLGMIPFLICAIWLALIAQRQYPGAGTLPSWLDSYQDREEIMAPLASYTQTNGPGVEDILRLIVRIAVMPFVNMIGAENRDGLLLLERLSPLILLLPVIAYGTGYLQGVREREKILTGIAESERKRVRKEKKERKRRAAESREPEQLN